MGNKTDISGNDLLEYWEDNPDVQAILMYLESFGNPRRFTQLARRVTRKKPIITVKAGRTVAARAPPRTPDRSGLDVAVDSLSSSAACCASLVEECSSARRPGPPTRAGRLHGGGDERRGPGDPVHGFLIARRRWPGRPATRRALHG
jgi:hypothetical protein